MEISQGCSTSKGVEDRDMFMYFTPQGIYMNETSPNGLFLYFSQEMEGF